MFITRVNPDPSVGLFGRISGIKHGHQDLPTFWIHSDEDQLQAGYNHTGWGYL